MCSPTLVVMSAAVAISAYAAHEEAEAANKAAEYNAQIAEKNAEAAEAQVSSAKERETWEKDRLRTMAKQTKGSQKSLFAASGARVDKGSALDVLHDTDYKSGQDILTLRRNTDAEVSGYRSQADDYRSQAKLSRMRKRDPGTAAFTTLLSGGSRMGSIYASRKG